MSAIAKLRVATGGAGGPPRSPARTALAEEIERARIIRERQEALTAAAAAANVAVFEAQGVVAAAEMALEAARKDNAEHLVRAAMGTAGVAPVSIKVARSRVTDAMDELAARSAARDTLDEQLAEARKPRYDTDRVKNAALRVVREDAMDICMAVVDRVESLQRDLVRFGSALNWLASAQVFEMDSPSVGRGDYIKDSRIHIAVSRFQSPVSSWHELYRQPQLRDDVRWTEALDRLMQDATAPIPSGI
jgi:hypothetical protein